MRTYAGTLDKSHAGTSTTIAGWVQKQRDFGELVFIDVRDRSGIVQVVVDRSKGASEELLALAKELRSEYVVRIAGEVRERAESTKNPKMTTGDVEVIATSIELLSRAETPPSTAQALPLTKLAFSDARNTATGAISST